MTLNIRGYEVTVIATAPEDEDIDSYTTTKMFLRELAIVFREAARANEINGFAFAAADYKREANKIHRALDILEGNDVRSK